MGSRPGGSSYGWQYLQQGGRTDPITGWQEFRARDYIVSSGHWAEKDPSGFGGGDLDLYRAEQNDPADVLDPSGTTSYFPVGVTLGANSLQFFNPFSSAKPRTTIPALTFWNTILRNLSSNPTEDWDKFRGGCIGLLKVRFNIPQSPEKQEGISVRIFPTQIQAFLFLDSLPPSTKKDARVFAIQSKNRIKGDIIDPATGAMEPMQVWNSARDGGRFNYATWHEPPGGTPHWEWLNSGFPAVPPPNLVKSGTLPSDYYTVYGVAILKTPKTRCTPTSKYDR